MSQVGASFVKTMKFFMRNRALLLGIVIWPMALLVLMSATELGTVPAADLPVANGILTIAMVVFALMLACIMNLPGSIARDREIGLLVKLRSMPIRPSLDTMGRLLAYLVFAVVVAALVTLVGLGLGARFSGDLTVYLEAVGFLFIAVIAAAGIGLILASFIKSLQAVAFFGLAVTLIFAFVSGIFVPYSQLSEPLQAFSRAFPISSASASVCALLLGPQYVGYDPLTPSQIVTSMIVAVVLLAVGLVVYHATGWRQETGRARHPRDRHRYGHHHENSGG